MYHWQAWAVALTACALVDENNRLKAARAARRADRADRRAERRAAQIESNGRVTWKDIATVAPIVLVIIIVAVATYN